FATGGPRSPVLSLIGRLRQGQRAARYLQAPSTHIGHLQELWAQGAGQIEFRRHLRKGLFQLLHLLAHRRVTRECLRQADPDAVIGKRKPDREEPPEGYIAEAPETAVLLKIRRDGDIALFCARLSRHAFEKADGFASTLLVRV